MSHPSHTKEKKKTRLDAMPAAPRFLLSSALWATLGVLSEKGTEPLVSEGALETAADGRCHGSLWGPGSGHETVD